MKDAYELINHTLVSLINEIWELEEKAIITEEFKDLSNNDMHVNRGHRAGIRRQYVLHCKETEYYDGVSDYCMNSLVNKKYVERRRSEEDRRVVYVS